MNTPRKRSLRPSRVSTIAIYLAFTAIALQILSRITEPELLPGYLILLVAFLLLFTLTLLFSHIRGNILNAYFAIQSSIVLILLSLDPNSDVVTGLFALLCYQAAMMFSGRTRWAWIVILIALTIGSLMFFLGPLRGLSLGMTPAGIAFALAFLVFANQEIEAASTESQALLRELEKKRVQLEVHAEQVEKLVTLEERNRLARELHDAVSQTIFSISLTTRSAQILLEQSPDQVRPHLEELQSLTNSALAELRSLVVRLRPGAE